MTDRLDVGFVSKGHGLKGDIVAKFTTDRTDERTARGAELFLDGVPYLVTGARSHGRKWILSLEGIASREDADALGGAKITADPITVDGAVFVHELIGKRMIDQDGTNRGQIESVLSNPASDLMELDGGQLIPITFYESHTDSEVYVSVPDGLWDLSE